ncbi:MAG: 5-formyltetrahydrofolate cyclo-ligase [Desulfobacterales bacterium]|uniref:5-formyltetrahydrofolate cyclo-ligase n=1 Tax=Candidatus Desulfatibia vada TaxID=2841696 RepID=A0A8J6NTN2_9BACT|nr:5-formyltetrahydrofolate cyclo-ligase [Candidatus Desulfatibia vada]MBL6972177.1 5-formyltetrahydrofolate cyclo-ligase [Desulfobacterales bacterium]
MDEIRATKEEIRYDIAKRLAILADSAVEAKARQIENRLFNFANFLEANIVLLYINSANEVISRNIIARCFDYNKIVVLPAFDSHTYEMKLMKVDNLETDLKLGPRGIFEPDEMRCNVVPIECIDIAIIPGTAFDEKGGRIGSGEGYYDRLIPKLSITTRKVALAFENQITQQIQMESHDKHVDIIITEKRIIYKI